MKSKNITRKRIIFASGITSTSEGKVTNNNMTPQEYLHGIKIFLRTVKPWKKRAYQDDEEFVAGWNACLKEIQKNSTKWFKGMEIICCRVENKFTEIVED